MTETEALARIAALCDESRSIVRTAEVRAILTDVTPTEGVTYYEYKDGVWISREDIPRIVYALRNQDHTSAADWALAEKLEKE